jgi:predicted metal-dependent phosphoesterase TrpH
VLFTSEAYHGSVETQTGYAIEVRLRERVQGAGGYRYVPFEVPPGVTTVRVRVAADRQAWFGVGVFDPRRAGHASAGFRGMCGSEYREFFVGLREATPGFTPGPIPPGRWTLILPIFLALLPTWLDIHIVFERGEAVEPARVGPLPGVVCQAPGWYRGDLHCHTEASSDARSTGAALTPAGWADQARALGLDFLAMTDHNVVSQNHALASDAGDGVLLLAGEEVTSYFHGHTTVSGIEPDVWLDFRLSPFGLALPVRGARIDTLIEAVHEAGGFVSAAHPMVPFLSWQFVADGLVRPSARPHALEVWNGRWQLHNEAALRLWHRLLCAGWDVVTNGGSDLHRIGAGLTPGTPTTVVHATALARGPVVAALRTGRSYLTARPDGVELYLTATGPASQQVIVGDTVAAMSGDVVHTHTLVRHAAGLRLSVITRHGPQQTVTLEQDEQLVEVPIVMGSRDDFVRVEVRRPLGTRLRPVAVMEAMTNPIRLRAAEPVATPLLLR